MNPQKDLDANFEVHGFVIEKPRIRANGKNAIRERDAATFLGCSVRKVQGLRQSGDLRAYRVGGTWWYPLDGLNDYLDRLERIYSEN